MGTHTMIAITRGSTNADELRGVGDGEGTQPFKEASEADLEVEIVDGPEKGGKGLELEGSVTGGGHKRGRSGTRGRDRRWNGR